MRLVGKILIGLLVFVLVVGVAFAGWFTWMVRRSYPQASGTIDVAGLSAPVTVVRDANGIPNIYADTTEDLFFAQGYVHAQDRFWQMDFNRHVTGGRISELVGESQLDTDKYLRTMGWRRVAEQEWALATGDGRTVLQAYADGVNAYIGDRSPTELGLEYLLLRTTGGAGPVEPWTPVDTLAWAKAIAWDLRGNAEDEVNRVRYAAGRGRPARPAALPGVPLRPVPRDRHPGVGRRRRVRLRGAGPGGRARVGLHGQRVSRPGRGRPDRGRRGGRARAGHRDGGAAGHESHGPGHGRGAGLGRPGADRAGADREHPGCPDRPVG